MTITIVVAIIEIGSQLALHRAGLSVNVEIKWSEVLSEVQDQLICIFLSYVGHLK